MRVTHIYHSGFAVELEGCSLVFDWYEGALPELPTNLPLVVFVSHSHRDHYDRRIWDLPRSFADVRYVVDADVARMAPDGLDVTSVGPHEDHELGLGGGRLRVRTLESNDEGVAFLVTVDRRTGEGDAEDETTLFFSGDLNSWQWDRAVDLNEASDAFFRRELGTIAGAHVSAAFVPVDPRLRDPDAGLCAYLDVVGADAVFPMHYWDDRAAAGRCLEDPRVAPYAGRIHLADVTEL